MPPPEYNTPTGPYGGGYPSANYGPQPQGNYGQYPPPADTHHVVLSSQPQPMTNTIVVQSPVIRPSSYLILAIFTTICCNLVFGIIAIIFSVMSSSSADNGDLEGARSKGKISMILSIVGIVITVLIIVFIIIYFTVIVSSLYPSLYDTYG
ncbi:unnamed protein product [Owenia fusiformis]|nr:unnamed protein product [Owenia fusiformis]